MGQGLELRGGFRIFHPAGQDHRCCEMGEVAALAGEDVGRIAERDGGAGQGREIDVGGYVRFPWGCERIPASPVGREGAERA